MDTQSILATGFTTTYYIFMLAFYVLEVIGMWKLFEKADIEGWKSIIPVYNCYCVYKLSWGNGWWFLINLVPCVGTLIGSIMTAVKMAKVFNKGAGTIVGLILLNPIFMMILGFGDAEYTAPEMN